MTAVKELMDCLLNFTPEQLERFLNDPVTRLILRPEEAVEPCLQEDLLCG